MIKKLLVLFCLLAFVVSPALAFTDLDPSFAVILAKGKNKGPNQQAIEHADDNARFKRCADLQPGSDEYKDCIKKEKEKADPKPKKEKEKKNGKQ